MWSFHWADYTVWALCLLLSLSTGIYLSWRKRRDESMEEYILGGRNMFPAAIALSWFATQVNSNVLIIAPAEVYLFGCIGSLVFLGQMLSAVICITFYAPVYHRMKVTSVYQYMEVRFGSAALRTISSVLFTINILLQAGLMLYVPSLCFNQVTGVQIYISVIVAGTVCILYTVFGGMRSVVWVDALQSAIFLGGMLFFVLLGASRVGSFNDIIERANKGGRFNFANFSFDPRTRYSFWTVSIGYAFGTLVNSGANQVVLQRVFSIKEFTDVRRYILGVNICAFPVYLLYGAAGVVLYAYYHDCDPISTGRVQRPEQLLPDFVMTVAGNMHGLPGLYMAAVFAASLSTLSSYINSLSAVCVEDFLKPICKTYFRKTLTPKEGKRWCMIFAAVFGVLSMLTSLIPQVAGTLVLAMIKIFNSAFMGPILTVFTLGIFVPFANKWGAFSGMFSCLVFALWMSVGSFYSKSVIPLPLDTSNCSFTWPPANFTRPAPRDDLLFQALYDVSYLWVGLYSLIVGVTMGTITSIITAGCRFKKQDVDPSLLYSYADPLTNNSKSDNNEDNSNTAML